MLVNSAITEPKRESFSGAKCCSIRVDYLQKWEYFTLLYQLFSYYFPLKHPRLMWKSPPKQGLTLSYARTARELEPDSPFKLPVRRLIRNSLQLGCQTIRRSTTFF
jgi:hypothetical protein